MFPQVEGKVSFEAMEMPLYVTQIKCVKQPNKFGKSPSFLRFRFEGFRSI